MEEYSYFLMTSPLQPAIIVVIYLAIVLKIGPIAMKKRKPFDLKTLLVVYNISQIYFNVLLLSQIVPHWPHISIYCDSLIVDDVELETLAMDLHYKYILLKVYDFLDTIFFVLRKKSNQMSLLHLYHHVFIFLFSWGIFKYFPVTNNYPPGPLVIYASWNTFVHAFMYMYYLLSVALPEYARNVNWKKSITLLQLAQHFTFLFLTLVALFDDGCAYPKGLIIFSLIVGLPILFMFIQFYYKTYCNKNTKVT